MLRHSASARHSLASFARISSLTRTVLRSAGSTRRPSTPTCGRITAPQPSPFLQSSVRVFSILNKIAKQHELLTRRNPDEIREAPLRTPDQLAQLRLSALDALAAGNVGAAMMDYAVLRAEPGAPVGAEIYKKFISIAHDEGKPDVRGPVFSLDGNPSGLC